MVHWSQLGGPQQPGEGGGAGSDWIKGLAKFGVPKDADGNLECGEDMIFGFQILESGMDRELLPSLLAAKPACDGTHPTRRGAGVGVDLIGCRQVGTEELGMLDGVQLDSTG